MSSRARLNKKAPDSGTTGETSSTRVYRTSTVTSSETISNDVDLDHDDSSDRTPPRRAKDSQAASARRAGSPFTIKREEEKDELAHLNNRLAYYIDYVRSLETDKTTLNRKVTSLHDTHVYEINKVKKLYEDEMAALRAALDGVAKDKAAAFLDAKKEKEDKEALAKQLGQKERECDMIERQLREAERLVGQYKGDHDRLVALKRDYETLQKQYEILKNQLEKETLLRTDLENKLQTLKEQLDFQNNLHKEQCQSLYERSIRIEEEVTDRKKAEFESKLADELKAMRDLFNQEQEIYKANIEAVFEVKMTEMKRINADSFRATRDVEIYEQRLRDLQNILDREREDHANQINNFKKQAEELRSELERKFHEFNDLMNIKIALDNELLAYRKLLEGEEARCNLEARDSPNSPFRKRKRNDSEEVVSKSVLKNFQSRGSAQGSVEITEVDTVNGKFVRIKNISSEKTVSLQGWQLKYFADVDFNQAEHPTVTYKFPRTFSLKPNQSCAIWNHETNTTLTNPGDLMMKSGLKFRPINNKATVQLVDAEGAIQAEYFTENEYRTTTTRSRSSRLAASDGGIEGGSTDEKCSIM